MRRTIITGLIAIAAASVVALSGCASTAGGSSSSISSDDLVGTWVTGESYGVGVNPFLDISEDGTWQGSDGCNGTAGTWEIASDGALTTTAGPSTMIYCGGAPLPTQFSQAKKAKLDGSSLLLQDAGGATIVELTPGTAPTPTNSSGGVVGTWGSVTAVAGEPVLVLSEDGSVSGSDGCNTLTGTWTSDGTTVTFGQLASTMMFCEGVDTWLVGASTATVEGDTLTVFDESAVQIGTLPRA
ncbi:META domain-containing protein [Compostimonas suwonensis]|uniref:Heat shock protein HslJ n=1 Tax=Compostimonas suwonensis TaxID=1048394 RepID=A0A2M9BZX3_9MICO|nr:META domain-containing protein [Compostimonas suwonensis]PJJ63626.1 heat shock protein HslJ [Compostimonas suwonensis]